MYKKIRKVKATKIFLKKRDYSLVKIITNDLIQFGKLPFYISIFNIITALTVITTVYHTRLLTIKYEQLLLEYNNLNINRYNLMLKKNMPHRHSRIEEITIKKLQIKHIDPSQENIIIKNN